MVLHNDNKDSIAISNQSVSLHKKQRPTVVKNDLHPETDDSSQGNPSNSSICFVITADVCSSDKIC